MSLCLQLAAKETPGKLQDNSLHLVENKGQITDQYNRPRKDIDYKMAEAGVTLYIGNGQLHYQWHRPGAAPEKGRPAPAKEAGRDTIYRMDVELVGADKNAVAIAEAPHSYTENYYLPQCPNGITAGGYGRITYKDVYPNIDWVLYTQVENGVPALKYDFVVRPGGDAARIQLRYAGATQLQLQSGACVATTPMGSIAEAAPYSYIAGSGEKVASAYRLQNNTLSFSIAADIPPTATLVIDPSLKWATYYGGSGTEYVSTIATDTAGALYLAGTTASSSNIATTGAYQTTIAGNYDGCLAKFNIDGVQQWATYYGGTNQDYFWGIATDASGDVYVTGSCGSAGLATTGAHQTTISGGGDALIVKFNNSGTRQWATYFGVATDEVAQVVACAGTDVYIGGSVEYSSSGLATTGAYQTVAGGLAAGENGFLAKFTSTGSRSWCTYFNGNIFSAATDVAGNVYIAGHTWASSGIASTGAHMTALSSTGPDGFLAKFNSSGSRLWGTYYGGSGHEWVEGIACDFGNGVYITGATTSTSGISTPASFKPSPTLPWYGEGFIVKFDDAGTRQWGTYYGGSAILVNTITRVEGITCDPRGNLYITGVTGTSDGICTPDAYKSILTGYRDAFIGILDANGMQQYGSLFGGNDDDGGLGASSFTNDIVYSKGRVTFCGLTTSTSGLATTSAHQASYGGSRDMFMAQFDTDTFLYINQPFTDVLVCGGDTLDIPYGVTQPFRSGNTFSIELSNSSGSFASPTLLGSVSAQTGGTFHYIVPTGITAGTGYRVRVRSSAPLDTAYEIADITLRPRPVVTAGSNAPVCSGNPLSLFATSSLTGATWAWTGPAGFSSTGSSVTRAAAQVSHSGDYIVSATVNGCTGRDTVNVTVNQTPELTSATSNSPVCANGNIELNATGNTPATVWSWSGPGGFAAAVEDTTLVSVPVSAGGTYTVTATLGSCSTKIDVPVTVVSGPTVAIYPSPNDSICTGTSVTFVAVPTNPGAAPQYQWMLNNNPVTGATGTRYTTTSIATGDEVKVVLTPGTGAACATVVNSNAIPVTVLPYLAPSVSMTATDDNAWPGLQVDFVAAAADAGSAPKYQWKLNNVNVQGATSNKWGSAALNNGDSVCIEVTSSYLCPLPKTAVACKRVKIATGIGNVDAASSIRIYPNPTSDKLVIEGVGKGTVITIIDITGREVYSTTASESNALVTTAALVPGNYLLQLQTAAGKRYRQKIVVSR